ncbi:hypothetical protein BIS47_02 [Klebsiella phage vB_KpnM_BIS47]|uniref:Uncharacterized protein n=1 Tax=Klebsiella phage vB_KpnM_BIS47 TaxID=1907784 RepID=A0A1V0E6L7_9CAUD|nr:hypothetical protein BIS47_02 [Klebsiella phage vB_KpnM_BIS47]ARB12506.1 hypothetical protein BIS47_02 [Klebsiella phage vB_KpnM_BIS47]UVX29333.1 hypothetical protein M5b_00059 [Klebsiella phage VLCpiM5b]
MGFPKLEIGDLVLVRQWNGEESVEICQYRGATGNLMLMVYHPDAILKSQSERFIRDTDSMPYSVSIVRKSDSEAWARLMVKISAQKGEQDERN